jgi:type II secretory pathway component PulM
MATDRGDQEKKTMHSATDDLPGTPTAVWHGWRLRARRAWSGLPPRWRGEAGRVVAGLATALLLLVAFHQVVQGGVERAASRDAALRHRVTVAAACSVERDAGQRALCLLTRPAGAGAVQVATLAR